jgi:hypothetical protein
MDGFKGLSSQLNMKTQPKHWTIIAGIQLLLMLTICKAEEGWIPLFNGKNLDGWTVKIAGHPLGVNFKDTYRVEDGIIKAYYDKYELFDMQFGHLYSNASYTNYIIRLQYKLPGKVMADAPSWANLNSGIMFHSQSPLSMTLEQQFPVSLEGQFLATGATAGTQTGNVCTPGTHIEVNGERTHAHIIDSSSRMFPGDEWVNFEAEVHGNDEIIYRVNGDEVLRYSNPILDPEDPDAKRLIDAGANLQLSSGHIALQAEGHPVWFRNIMIKPLNH